MAVLAIHIPNNEILLRVQVIKNGLYLRMILLADVCNLINDIPKKSKVAIQCSLCGSLWIHLSLQVEAHGQQIIENFHYFGCVVDLLLLFVPMEGMVLASNDGWVAYEHVLAADAHEFYRIIFNFVELLHLLHVVVIWMLLGLPAVFADHHFAIPATWVSDGNGFPLAVIALIVYTNAQVHAEPSTTTHALNRGLRFVDQTCMSAKRWDMLQEGKLKIALSTC